MSEPIKITHFSDLHFGSGERYGSINPETGLNRRFEDFILAMDKVIDFSINNDVDLVIFTGDTFKHAVPEPIYQREFAKRIKKLSLKKIPTILLVGNHDVLYRIDGSDALDIYSTLGIDHVTVFNKVELKNIETKKGLVQIIALPHVTKSRLLTKEENRNLSSKDQDQLMIEKVKTAIEGYLEDLDPKIPSVLIGHGTIEKAQFGSEQDLSIGKVLSYPLSYFQHKELDYVGFGHIHRRQVLQESNPIILYAGSIERVDFGEEDEEKSFVFVNLKKGKTTYEFIPTNPRKFITISKDLRKSTNPQSELEEIIKKKTEKGAIVRVRYQVTDQNSNLVDEVKIRDLLKETFSFYIQQEIDNGERTFRVAELDSSLVSSPITALEKYLFDQSEEDKNLLLEKAKNLMNNI